MIKICQANNPFRILPSCWILVLLLGGILLPFAGCRNQSSASSQEEESHEHFPVHWPKTIFAASERMSELSKSVEATSSNPEITVEREFIDLIRWLPELAADSELSEKDFNRIDAWSTKTVLLLEEQVTNGKKLKDLVELDGLISNVEMLADVCRLELDRTRSPE